LFVLENEYLTVTITNYGLRIVHLFTYDQAEQAIDIIVGPETPQQFFASNNPYYGAVIGRFANRISKGRFQLHGNAYQLTCNNGANHLHGGPQGLQNQVWDCIMDSKEKLIFSHTSPHLSEQYPGTVSFEVVIELKGRSLHLHYRARTDVPTILNITHHPFFNLDGCGSIDLRSHQLQLHAKTFLPVDMNMIPEGNESEVNETAFDFTEAASITDRLTANHVQLERGHGFDHCFVRADYPARPVGWIASVSSQKTGICMRISTSEPGVQLYTGNFMDGSNQIKNNGSDTVRSAFCLETQHFPDSPNQPHFPSVVLLPGETFHSTTIFEFSIIP
jgi:aldose 1-epimerase